MPILDQHRVYDGVNSFIGGQDAGKRPNLIDPSQCARIENAVCRGGSLQTRPAFKQLSLNFLNTLLYFNNGTFDTTVPVGSGVGGTGLIQSSQAFLEGLFQGAAYYDPSVADDSLMVSVGGRLFKVVPKKNSADVTEIALDKRNRKNIPVAYLIQADRFLLIQDGESTCIIYDGVKARRAVKDELPVGTIMAYGMGRVVLIGVNKRDILFGDLYGSHPGEPGESVLKFTETTFLSEGGAASIPFSMGHIKGATFYPIQDTSMGQGELLVFAEKGMASFALSLPRDQWKTSQFQRLGLIEIGGRGHRAFTPINGDVWFRAGDGWRSYRQARAEAKGWYQLPLSNEVGNYVQVESQAFLTHASSIHFNNRLIATVTAYPNQGKVYHNGFVPLDFDVLSSFGQATKPAWDGHWHGIKTIQLVEGNFGGVHRAFAFGLDNNCNNALYEITQQEVEDFSGPITSSFDSRSFTFEQPFNENNIYDADTWFDSVRAPTTVQAFLKPDQYPQWLPWNPNCPIAPLEPINGLNTLAGIGVSDKGFKPRRSLGKPNPSCDSSSTNRDLKRAYEIQVRLQWTGNAAVSKFRLHGKPEVERATAK